MNSFSSVLKDSDYIYLWTFFVVSCSTVLQDNDCACRHALWFLAVVAFYRTMPIYLWTVTVTVTILMDILCGLLRYRAVTSESSAQGVDAPLVKTMGPRKLLKMLELFFFSSALGPRSTAALCAPRVTVAACLCPFWLGCTRQRCCVNLC